MSLKENMLRKRQEVVIAVMGVTGAGKSSFVKLATGDSNVKIGHGLNAGTQVTKVGPGYLLLTCVQPRVK